MDDFVLVITTTFDGYVERYWIPCALVPAVLWEFSFVADIYKARAVWVLDQDSRAWDLSM
jgi:hypothetical protein